MDDEIRVTVIATGFDQKEPEPVSAAAPAREADKPEPVLPEGKVAEPTVLDIADDPKPEEPEDDPFADIFKIFQKRD